MAYFIGPGDIGERGIEVESSSRLGGAERMGKNLMQRGGGNMSSKEVMVMKENPGMKLSWGSKQLSPKRRNCPGSLSYFLPSI